MKFGGISRQYSESEDFEVTFWLNFLVFSSETVLELKSYIFFEYTLQR